MGEKADSITEGIGYLGGLLATGGAGGSLGLGERHYSFNHRNNIFIFYGFWHFSGIQRGGNRQGSYNISGAAEAGTELLFGGLGKSINAVGISKGLSSADDMLAKKISGIFSKQITKNIAETGVKMTAEGTEEVLSGIIQAVGQKANLQRRRRDKQTYTRPKPFRIFYIWCCYLRHRPNSFGCKVY